jgi:hypothetical protein
MICKNRSFSERAGTGTLDRGSAAVSIAPLCAAQRLAALPSSRVVEARVMARLRGVVSVVLRFGRDSMELTKLARRDFRRARAVGFDSMASQQRQLPVTDRTPRRCSRTLTFARTKETAWTGLRVARAARASVRRGALTADNSTQISDGTPACASEDRTAPDVGGNETPSSLSKTPVCAANSTWPSAAFDARTLRCDRRRWRRRFTRAASGA